MIRHLASFTLVTLPLALLMAASTAKAQAGPEVSVVVGVGQNLTLRVGDFAPRKALKVWLLAPPSSPASFCLNNAIPQGVCGIDVGAWRTDPRGTATISFNWPSYFCAQGTRTHNCRRRAWRHGMRAIAAVYSSDLFDEAEARVTVR